MNSFQAADNVYEYARENIKNVYKEQEVKTDEQTSGNRKDFYADASDYYCEVIQKDNGVLYITAYPDAKEEAKK